MNFADEYYGTSVCVRVARGEKQRRNIHFFAQKAEERKAVAIRQVDIQNHQFRRFAGKGGLRGGAVCGGSDMAVARAGELVAQQAEQVRIVIHQQKIRVINGTHASTSNLRFCLL